MSRETAEKEGMVKGRQTHLVPREMEAREVDERERGDGPTFILLVCCLRPAVTLSKQ